jgi:hypothetical protein
MVYIGAKVRDLIETGDRETKRHLEAIFRQLVRALRTETQGET